VQKGITGCCNAIDARREEDIMDCEYILQNEIHEKYLKGLLTDDQKAEYESHLKSCESCRKAFENEKVLFEGIQYSGRAAMKLEIERQVEKLREEQSETDWTLIFKVAAVLFFLVIMPGTLYFLNTDLFTKKAEMAPIGKVDSMTGIEMEETESASEIAQLEEMEEPVAEREVSSRREAKGEKSVSTSRGKEISDDLRADKSISEKRDDLESIHDLTGSVEGTAGKDAVSGAGVVESVSKQIAPGTLSDMERERTTTAAAQAKKIETGKMQRKAPIVSPQMSRLAAEEPVKEQKISELSLENDLDSEQKKGTVYKLSPSQPILLQENYMKSTDSGRIKSESLNTLNFSSGYKQIVANIAPLPVDLDKKMKDKVTDTFKVILLSKSPDLINMDWYPQFDVSVYQPDKISITQPDKSNLLINFNEKYIYKVDISKDTTEAILQK
jgi:hypothetical protein